MLEGLIRKPAFAIFGKEGEVRDIVSQHLHDPHPVGPSLGGSWRLQLDIEN